MPACPVQARQDTLSGSYVSIRELRQGGPNSTDSSGASQAASTRLQVVSAASAATTVQAGVATCGSVLYPVNAVLMPALGRRRMGRL